MPQRHQPPPVQHTFDLNLPSEERIYLDNGIPVHLIELGSQEVMKLEMVFKAGRPYEQKKLAARATSRLLREGAGPHDSEIIADTFEYFGATLGSPANMDASQLVVYCLPRYFPQLIPILAEVLTRPLFPEEELQRFVTNSLQRLKVNLSKNDYVAYRELTEQFFGTHHPYGYNSSAVDFKALQRQDLVQHFQRTYRAGNCEIFLSGRPGKQTVTLLNEFLGRSIPEGHCTPHFPDPLDQIPQQIHLSRPKARQTAIRLGKRLFGRNHPDMHGLHILNNILGGYFGSRLMTNLREQKGYTYNVFSTIDTFSFGGYFYIGAEVGNEVAQQALEEIYHEVRLLQEEPVPTEELEMVRNYMLGNLLELIDGPFNVAEVYKSMALQGLPDSFLNDVLTTLEQINPDQLQKLARQYLDPDSFWEIRVGP